jgi:hypothetical protein
MVQADDFAKVDPPTKMPASVVQRLKNLKCPPPIVPSKYSARINALNSAMAAQMTEIEMLEKVVTNLESRYKISFTCDNNPKFDLFNTELPRIDLSGNLTNISLDLHLWEAQSGSIGLPGYQGEMGIRGNNALDGPPGISGYYGIRGDTK